MADLLKRENDIVTLKVELAPGDRVSCVLQFLNRGQLQSHPLWEGPISAFGIDCALANKHPSWNAVKYVVPKGLRVRLKSGVRYLTPLYSWSDLPLWVHLVKPYGALRFIPWERLLPVVLDVPVLMLPDFIFPPPRKSASRLDIALCASAPLDCDNDYVFDATWTAIDAILQGLDGQVPRLHVFAGREMAQRLQRELFLPDNVLIHDQAQAEPFFAADPSSRRIDRTGSLRSPWLLWMRETLRPYSTDVVHFVCHGHLSAQSGAMLFAQSPLERTDNYLAGPVGAAELGSFLTQVGAWSTVFSPPRDNHDPAGLRALADELAQSLPGPMMLYDGRYGQPTELEQGYRFVHAEGPQDPPRSRALYLYCQPYLMAEGRGRPDAEDDAGASIRTHIDHYARNASQRDSALRAIPEPVPVPTPAPTPTPIPRHIMHPSPAAPVGKSISAVTAATERFAENVQLQYQQLMRDDVVPDAIARRDMDTSMETVDMIRQAVNRVEQQRLANDIDTRLDRVELAVGPAPDDGNAHLEKPTEPQMLNGDLLKQIENAWLQLHALRVEANRGTLLPAEIDTTPLEVRTLRIRDDLEVRHLRELLQDGEGTEP
ncbi:hypothetical protein [Stenotrophomonas sp. PSU-St83]